MEARLHARTAHPLETPASNAPRACFRRGLALFVPRGRGAGSRALSLQAAWEGKRAVLSRDSLHGKSGQHTPWREPSVLQDFEVGPVHIGCPNVRRGSGKGVRAQKTLHDTDWTRDVTLLPVFRLAAHHLLDNLMSM